MPPESHRPTGPHAPGAGPAPLPARRPGASDLTVFTTRPPGRTEGRDGAAWPWRWLPADRGSSLLPAGLQPADPAADARTGPFLSAG
jgi:hypothetical protein